MKQIIYFFAAVSVFTSCSEKKADTPAVVTDSSIEKKAKPAYLDSIRYSDWEIGNPENIKTVLDVYQTWDKKEMSNIAQFFADTVRLRIPDEKEEIVIPNNKINEALSGNRDMYDSSSNNIISAVSLHDRQSDQDWVMITAYTKWIEKGGKRDSVIYSDSWYLKNGKISLLMSFDKKPTKTFLKNNPPN